MKTLVISRISHPRFRRSLRSRLQDRGLAIAPGIYECDLEPAELATLERYLEGLDYGPEDCVLLCPICASCEKKRLVFGSSYRRNDSQTPWVIL